MKEILIVFTGGTFSMMIDKDTGGRRTPLFR